ncbi:MAG: phosphatase PAP2 family protein [Ignavibacteria bacterium]|nr:phosphatase PAP2 family protein [Ignavibacteria bacterium]
MKNGILFLLLTVLCGQLLLAQNGPAPVGDPKLRYTFSQFGDETWLFIKQPTTWKARDWLTLGAIGAGTYALMETADQPARDWALSDQRYAKSVPMEIGRMWGDLYMPFVLFGGYAIHSLLTDDMGSRKIAYEIGQASIYAGIITYLLKWSIGRSRPYVNEGPHAFHSFTSPLGALSKSDYQSLPGGHNVAAFVFSTVLSRNASALWLKILAYVPAALTFVSRVYQDKHWVSDDFAGAAMGYVIATWVVDQHEAEPSPIGVTSLYPLSITVTF